MEVMEFIGVSFLYCTEIGFSQLTTLKLETVLTDIPLQLVGEQCTNLVELQVNLWKTSKIYKT